jgi:PTS system glucitol/sorbitol-specific IIA component
MSQAVWESTVARIGKDATELFEAGIFILFAEPVPDALAEVSLVHHGPDGDFAPIEAGDELCIGDTCLVIEEVGSRANENFRVLGHIVVYLNVGDTEILPGAVKATGPLPVPAVGDAVVVRRLVA